jgi:hypothetical protein
MAKKTDAPAPSKAAAPTMSATVTFAAQSSDFANVLGAHGPSAGPTIEEFGGSETFVLKADSMGLNNLELVSPGTSQQAVRYYTDWNGDGLVNGSDTMVFQGNPDKFTFADLVKTAETLGIGRFTVGFDDGGGGLDRDYNDYLATVSLSSTFSGHANSGRGNGGEYAWVDGLKVELDPGNSAGHNHGGDFIL